MHFDTTNHVVKLCIQGMNTEGTSEEASALFMQAWNEATNDFERFIASHYVARHQKSIADKLKWDETALRLALQINDHRVIGLYPSLYLNIAKCYEDLNELGPAYKNYHIAHSFINRLPDDGYGKMITRGILNGFERLKLLEAKKKLP